MRLGLPQIWEGGALRSGLMKDFRDALLVVCKWKQVWMCRRVVLAAVSLCSRWYVFSFEANRLRFSNKLDRI